MTMAYHAFKSDDGSEYGSFEVFYDNADVVNGHARNFDSDGEPVEAGWYWWPCFPGCMPESDAIGPFATEAEAIADANKL
jgi:hypothetical protein